MAAAAAIDLDGNVVAKRTYDNSVNTGKFLEYLAVLRRNCKKGKLYLVLDNLPVHHSKAVRDYCACVDIELVFAPPYSSEYMSVERLWRLSKVEFKQLILRKNTKKIS